MESARSPGYFCQRQLEDREYFIEEPIGVAESDTSQTEYLTLCLDSYPERHLIGRPGMKTMLVLADALRLIGLSTPQSIDVECVYFNPHYWDLLNPDPDTHGYDMAPQHRHLPVDISPSPTPGTCPTTSQP